MSKKTFIDIFSGCGGLSEGFMQTNKYKGLAHLEWEFPMVETLRHRLVQEWGYTAEAALESVIHFDLQNTKELLNGDWDRVSEQKFKLYNSNKIRNRGLSEMIDSKVDLIIGGPTCQAYSVAGRAQSKDRMNTDYRNFLFESYVSTVNEFRPEIFLFENVPGILSAAPGGVIVTERIYEAFKEIGYDIKKPSELKGCVFNSVDFGVPQTRRRVIIIGVKTSKTSKDTLSSIYSDLRNLTSKKGVTVREAIGDLGKLFPNDEIKKEGRKKISHSYRAEDKKISHVSRYHNNRDVNIFRKWISEEGNKFSNSEKLDFYKREINKQTKCNKYRSLDWDKSAPTIVAHLEKDGLLFIHPDKSQARSLTVREAAKLQSFPDDFEFIANQGYQYKMIGNAVPPTMAKLIGKVLLKYL